MNIETPLRSSFMLMDDKSDLVLYIKYLMDLISSGHALDNMDMLYVNILMSNDVEMIHKLETYLKLKKKLDLRVLEMLEYINE